MPDLEVGSSAADVWERVLTAHGGLTHWQGLSAVEAEVSCSGLLFALKRQPPLLHARVVADTRACRLTLRGPYGPGRIGEWLGDEVRLRDDAGVLVAERRMARAEIGKPGKLLRWDPLDMLYFAGYALWNYLTMPFLLCHPGVRMTRLADDRAGRACLRVDFPPSLPTHCRQQVFHIERNGEIARHIYTADVIGGWARVAHDYLAYQRCDGLAYPSRRWVRPIVGSWALPGPTIVAIQVHTLRAAQADGLASWGPST